MRGLYRCCQLSRELKEVNFGTEMDKRTRALVLKDFSGRVGSGPGEKKTVEGAGKKKQKQKTFATLVEGGILICW